MEIILQQFIADEKMRITSLNLKNLIEFSDGDLFLIRVNKIHRWEMNAFMINDSKYNTFIIPPIHVNQLDVVELIWVSDMEISIIPIQRKNIDDKFKRTYRQNIRKGGQ